MLADKIAESLQREAERRYSTRYVFRGDIEVRWGSRLVWGRVLNISRTGMFIELPENPPMSAEFLANLALNAPLKLKCKVRRTVPNYGVGVTIAVEDAQDRERFNALLFALAQGADPEGTSSPVPVPAAPPRSSAAVAGSAVK